MIEGPSETKSFTGTQKGDWPSASVLCKVRVVPGGRARECAVPEVTIRNHCVTITQVSSEKPGWKESMCHKKQKGQRRH